MKKPPERAGSLYHVGRAKSNEAHGSNSLTQREDLRLPADDFKPGCRLEVGGPFEPSDTRWLGTDTRPETGSQRNPSPPQGARITVRPVGKAGPARAGSSHSEHIRGDGMSGYPVPYLGKNMGGEVCLLTNG